jgi:hypothetical protein
MSDEPDDVGITDAHDETGRVTGAVLWERTGAVGSIVLVPR